jgi:hypothetical protein
MCLYTGRLKPAPTWEPNSGTWEPNWETWGPNWGAWGPAAFARVGGRCGPPHPWCQPVLVGRSASAHRPGARLEGKWNRGPRKVHRVAFHIDHDFHDIPVVDFVCVGDPAPQRRHLDAGVAFERRNQLRDGLRLDERFVALDVDDDLAVEIRRDFGNPIESGAVLHARHADDPAEALHRLLDPGIIGGHDHRIHALRGRRAGVHVLDHRAAGDVGERFAWKACRLIAGGDDGDGVQRL